MDDRLEDGYVALGAILGIMCRTDEAYEALDRAYALNDNNIYLYQARLFEAHADGLPTEKSAPIAIMGAGVSGLLAAHFLKCEHKFTNVALYEITDRFGGKTVTITEDAPKFSSNDPDTACELGTCYLSPAYDDMYTALTRRFEGNARLGLRIHPDGTQSPNESFRGMVTEDQFPGVSGISAVMVEAIIESFQNPNEDKPLVTYLEKGWLEVWRKMSKDVDIRTGMMATRIARLDG